MKTKNASGDYDYMPKMTRRDSIKWLGLLTASAAMPGLVACTPESNVGAAASSAGHWPTLNLKPIESLGYGKDPNLIIPPTTAWPRTLTQQQLNLVAKLGDILVPNDGTYPAASEVGVPDVVDEWVSAPYGWQQRDRETIMGVLQWIDDESQLRFKQDFVAADSAGQMAIIEDIAYRNDKVPEQFTRAADAFARFRSLVLAAYFCSPEGTKEIGYMGNVVIAGDYPGPTEEALAHINGVLDDLGLSEYAWQD